MQIDKIVYSKAIYFPKTIAKRKRHGFCSIHEDDKGEKNVLLNFFSNSRYDNKKIQESPQRLINN